MKLHEYQAKQLLAGAGITIQRGHPARTPEEAAHAYDALRRECQGADGFACNIKAQLHAGAGQQLFGLVLVEFHPTTCATRRLRAGIVRGRRDGPPPIAESILPINSYSLVVRAPPPAGPAQVVGSRRQSF